MTYRGVYPGVVVQYSSSTVQDILLDVLASGSWEIKEKKRIACEHLIHRRCGSVTVRSSPGRGGGHVIATCCQSDRPTYTESYARTKISFEAKRIPQNLRSARDVTRCLSSMSQSGAPPFCGFKEPSRSLFAHPPRTRKYLMGR